MNRSLKVFVATVLALSLCLSFGSALAKKQDKPPKAPKPVVTSIGLSLTDRAGTPFTPVGVDTYTVVTGQKYVVKAVVEPTGIKKSLRWRSNRPGVANVDSRGNVFCVRPGEATITVAAKSGAVKKSIFLKVEKNMATLIPTTDNPINKIYLKGKYLCIDVVYNNSTLEAMETVPNLTFSLKLVTGDYPTPGVKSGHLRREIPAGGTGTAVYRIQKVDPRTIWLLDATASCKVPG